jgi:hypothetical protein
MKINVRNKERKRVVKNLLGKTGCLFSFAYTTPLDRASQNRDLWNRFQRIFDDFSNLTSLQRKVRKF